MRASWPKAAPPRQPPSIGRYQLRELGAIGGIVLERTFADALGAAVSDRVGLDKNPFTVAGIAVTAAQSPYPDLCRATAVASLSVKGGYETSVQGACAKLDVTEPNRLA